MPASHGLSPERLTRIDGFLRDSYVDTGKLPGALLQVWRRGELVHTGMSGMIDIAGNRPMRDDAIFRIFSMSKPITAVALLTMVEDGRLALHDKVSKHIPEWADLQVLTADGDLVPLKREMTILDLARHTSGLSGFAQTAVHRMYGEKRIGAFNTPGGLDGMIAALTGLPLEFQPGEGVTYSVGTTVLGYIIQKVAGVPFSEYLSTRIFEPLGMTETGFFCPPEKAERLAATYRWQKGGTTFNPDSDHDFTKAPDLESGSGGLVSTVADYMRFCRMLLGGGTLDGVQILSRKSVELMRANQLPGNRDIVEMSGDGRFDHWIPDGIGIALCAGTTMDVARRMMPASLGDIFWAGAAGTYMLVDPAEELAVVFMTQLFDSPNFHDLQRRLYTMVYAAIAD